MKNYELKDNQRSRITQLILAELGYIGGNALAEFQAQKGLSPDGVVGPNTYAQLYKAYLQVVEVPFAGAYHAQMFEKKQIVWHHSAGWDKARQMFEIWKNDKAFHVATAIGIEDSGLIVKGYDERFWAVHIGAFDIGLPNYLSLERYSVGVEVCNWGCLEEKNGKLYSWAGAEVPREKAIELNYKNYKYYEAYTDAEIESLRKWTLLMAIRFDIPLAYSHADMWEVSAKAQAGTPGLYTHNSYVSWKSDVSPQPKLIAMAKQIAEI